MKTTFIITLFGFFLIYSALATDPEASAREITRDNVRVVLMSVSQTTVFPARTERTSVRTGGKDTVPCFTVTVLLEALGDRPFDKLAPFEVQLLSAGKPLSLSSSASYQQAFSYDVYQDFLDFSKPKVTNPKRATIMRYADFGALPSAESLDLVVRAGFDDEVRRFEFKSISIK